MVGPEGSAACNDIKEKLSELIVLHKERHNLSHLQMAVLMKTHPVRVYEVLSGRLGGISVQWLLSRAELIYPRIRLKVTT